MISILQIIHTYIAYLLLGDIDTLSDIGYCANPIIIWTELVCPRLSYTLELLVSELNVHNPD